MTRQGVHKSFLIKRIQPPTCEKVGQASRSNARHRAEVGQLSGHMAEMLEQHETSEAQEGDSYDCFAMRFK